MRWMVLVLISCTPLWAQDHSACFADQDVPDGSPAPTAEQAQAVASLGIGHHVIPTAFRRLCGLAGPADQDHMREILDKVGCSEGSPVGQREMGYLAMDLDPFVQAFFRCDPRVGLSESEFAHFCAMTGEVVMPLPGAQGSIAWLNARNTSITAMQRIEALLSNANKRGCS